MSETPLFHTFVYKTLVRAMTVRGDFSDREMFTKRDADDLARIWAKRTGAKVIYRVKAIK